MRIIKKEHCLLLAFKYDPFLVASIKKIKGGFWNPREKAWQFPLSKYQELSQWMHMIENPCVEKHERMEILRKYLIRKGYSRATIKSYMMHFDKYLSYSNNSVDIDRINDYIEDTIAIKELSYTYVNQFVSAIKLYAKVSQTTSLDNLTKLERPRGEKKLPKAMSPQQISRLFKETTNLKHLTGMMLAYSAGLRISDVVNLKIEDIDTEGMLILIKESKGNKERYVPLSKVMKKQLNNYFEVYTPKKWVFENINGDHLSTRTFQKVFATSRDKAGLKKSLTFHSLRHSFACELLESQVNLRYIQEILGHESSKTTEIYTQISVRHYQKIKNPLDYLKSLYDGD
ncbi:integrase [Acidaminobacter sp. JC074]|uniref:tyrosine-type recombinase/integrase n=1 Tax=Acidaminobacter sp. JC074 TaxID=2530199 RepID=UPI001F0D8C54|nr:tyrosine-type recombinase/integrase [Acidaminobacter sp. JC074]MCH4891327.1 integrase [Acidaminobacter sp. JC074]